MDNSDVVAMLRKAKGEDSLRIFAAKVGVTAPYIRDILIGNRDPGPSILKFLGLQEKRTVVRKRKK